MQILKTTRISGLVEIFQWSVLSIVPLQLITTLVLSRSCDKEMRAAALWEAAAGLVNKKHEVEAGIEGTCLPLTEQLHRRAGVLTQSNQNQIFHHVFP